MKRVKSAVFNSIRIRDLSLKLTMNDCVEIPDEIFYASQDLQKLIKAGKVICEGFPHQGKIVDFSLSSVRSYSATQPNLSFEKRIAVLEKAISQNLQENHNTTHPKYNDYQICSNALLSLPYQAMIFEPFLDESKRNSLNPGTGTVNGVLSVLDNETSYSYHSIDFELESVSAVFPILSYQGDGNISMIVHAGDQDYTVFDTMQNIDLLWSEIPITPKTILSISLFLKEASNKTYNLSVSSYALLLKLDT